MNFSDLYEHSSIIEYSPNGNMLAICKNTKVLIVETTTYQNLHEWAFGDTISQIEWSPDSSLLLIAFKKSGLAYVKSLSDDDWNCRIDEGGAGLAGIKWAPDSRQVMTISDFQLRLTIWSLVDKSAAYIKNPKFCGEKGLAFSSDGKFMALAERRDSKDYVGIYYCGDWTLVHHFQTDTFDLADLAWSKDNTSIVVWDSCVEYKLLVYSLVKGLVAKHTPYDKALGIKSVSFSPNGQYLSVGSYDQSARIFNHISWNMITELKHPSQLTSGTDLQVYVEDDNRAEAGMDQCGIRYKLQGLPVKLKTRKVEPDKPNPPIGVSILAWSFDSKLLATKDDNMPHCLWIWDMSTLELSNLLVHYNPIKSVAWSPKSPHLAFCTGTSQIFLWSREGASVCTIPIEAKDFSVQRVEWNPNGRSLIVVDKVRMTVACPQPDFFDQGAPKEIYHGEDIEGEYEEVKGE